MRRMPPTPTSSCESPAPSSRKWTPPRRGRKSPDRPAPHGRRPTGQVAVAPNHWVADNAVMEGGGSCGAVASAGVDVRIRLLGGFAVLIDGVPAPERWRLRKAKSLVKVLAL